MKIKAVQLIQLAETRFNLTDDERKLLNQISVCRDMDNNTNNNVLDDSTSPIQWEPNYIISASVIIWLCTNSEARPFITDQGLYIVGAKIEGSLNLKFSDINFPLIFIRCVFTEVVRIEWATIKLLNLSGCYLAASKISDLTGASVTSSLEARGLKVQNDVLLHNGFQATGRVYLYGSVIEGNLECYGSTFNNPQGDALIAERAEIKGFVFLHNGFQATGTVSLSGITVSRSLVCSGSKFNNPDGFALIVERAEIKAFIFLHNGFQATGAVSLSGTTIGGNLVCNQGQFNNPQGYALIAQHTEIKGSVLLNDGFQAMGEVSLYGTTIGWNLTCNQGKFNNPKKGYALIAQCSEIRGFVYLNNGFQANGEVSLYGTTIGGNLVCNQGQFNNAEGYALNAQRTEIKGSVLLNNDFQAIGRISFRDTTIQYRLSMGHSSPLKNSDAFVLDFQFATVCTIADMKESWPSSNNLYLNGFSYEKISQDCPTSSTERLKWIRLQNQETKFYPQPYEQLAHVFKENGYKEEAIKVLIKKQRDHRFYGKLNKISWFWNWFLDNFIGYGYQPHKVLRYALVLITFGTFMFSWGYSSLITPSQVETFELSSISSSKPISENYPKFNPFVYSLDVFIPIMDLHQQRYWLPNANRGQEVPFILFKCKTGTLLRWYFWLHIILGWSITSVWVAGFTGLVHRVE